jgi:hypothetical protein
MKTFLQRFAGLVLGVLSGFDRLVFRGRLCPLYSPEGMNVYLSANGVLRKDYEKHVQGVTEQVLRASLIESAKAADCYRYLPSTKMDKDAIAREYARRRGVNEGLVCVLQCVEPCWSFALESVKGRLTVRGKQRKCSHLYHYFLDAQMGWMYVRLQTWFPFEMQIYVNGREWLCRRLEREGVAYRRSDNKVLWVRDWQQAQRCLDEQLQTNWVSVLDAYQKQVHPLHPRFLGKLCGLRYNWTTFQSEWATDVAFESREELGRWMSRWQRQSLHYDSAAILRFLGRTGRITNEHGHEVETEYKRLHEGLRVKHWVDKNSLKLYDHQNVARVETTINDVDFFKVFRASQADPEGPLAWRKMRRTVADLHRRAEVSEQVNARYLESMAAVQETRKVKELAEPLCERVREPGRTAPGKTGQRKTASRKVRALNPWSAEDGQLLKAMSDPKWMISGLRNRDLVSELYPQAATDATEKRRRSARVTRLIRLLRGHGLLHKIAHTHRYQVSEKARTILPALLAAADANPKSLIEQAA